MICLQLVKMQNTFFLGTDLNRNSKGVSDATTLFAWSLDHNDSVLDRIRNFITR